MLLNKDTGKTQDMHGASCSCPACLGLQCLERPRYFSGQLLTEMDLNSEQEYILAKQKLHNRYLHGSGIVCGLQVSCSTCAGAVTIESGYAIDPCGNDIIVCDAQDFNIIQRIHDCEKARKRQRKSNCDPIKPPSDANCRDLERHYCLTIAYTEQETRLSPTLRQGSTTSTGNGKGSTCGCNGNGKKNGCGCNSSSSSSSSGSQYTNSMAQTTSYSVMSQSSASSASSASNSAISCQPTRVLEGYQFDICEVPPDYCGNIKDVLEDTLLAKIIECFTSLKDFLDKKLPDNVYAVLTPLAFTGNIDTAVSMDELYRSCCYLRQTIHELYGCDPLNTHCQTLDVLSQVCCQSPPCGEVTEEVRASYVEQTRATLYDLLALLMQYMLDCVCQALLPCCPTAPADDRLILACMTVKDDRIVDICNFCHRRYAGSFPALYYWLSLVPVIPLIAYAVERLCCYDWLKREFTDRQGNPQSSVFRGNLVNGLTSLLNSMDPAGSLRKEMFANNFAMPKNYAEKFAQLINKVSSPMKVAEMLQPEAFNLTSIINKSVAEATTTLQAAGVTPSVHAVASTNEVPILRHLTTPPFAAAGDHVVLYSADDKVVGYAALTSLPDIEQVKHDVASLKENMAQVPQAADVSQLKSDVETIKGNVANTAQASDLDALKSDIEAIKGKGNAVQPSDLEAVRNDVETLKGGVANAAQSAALDEVKNDVETLKGNLANAAQSSSLEPVKNDVETLKANLANAAQSADLEAVKNDVETLKGNVTNAAQAADLAQLRSDLAQFAQATDVNQLRSDVESLTGNVANAAQSSAIESVRNDVEALKGTLANAAQSSALDEVKNDVEALKGSLANAAQTSDLEGVRNDLQTLKDAVANTAQTADVSQLKSDLAQFAQATDVNQLKSDVEGLKSDLTNAAQTSALDPIKNDVETLKGNVANTAQSADLDAVRNDIETLKGNVANAVQPSALEPITSDIQALKGDITNAVTATEVSGIRDEVSGLKDEVATLRDLQSTIKALQDELAALRSEIDQLKARDTGDTGNAGKAEGTGNAGGTGDTGDAGDTPPAEPAQ